MLWVTLCIVIATIVFMRVLLSVRDFIRERAAVKKLPCPPGAHWLKGHTKLDPFGAGLQWMLDTVKVCPRAYVMWNGPFALPVLVHPEHIKALVASSTHSNKSILYKVFEDWVGRGLVTANGAHWKRNRRLLTASFHLDVLRTYIPVFHKCTDVYLDKLDRVAAAKTPMRVYKELSLCTFDAILQTAFSYESNVQNRPLQDGKYDDMLHATEVLSRVSNARMVSGNLLEVHPWTFPYCSMYSDWAENTKYVRNFARGLVIKRQEELDQKMKSGDSLGKPRDFLDTVLMARDEDGTRLTIEEIVDEASTFLFGGFETTSTTLTWVLYVLAKYPEHQEKVRQEVDDILADREAGDIMNKDFVHMEYMTLVIKETIRLYNVVVLLSRTLTEPLEVDGVTLLTGTTVAMNLYQLHHNPTVWGDDHMEFKPSRFLSENFNKMDPFSFMAFSAGPRNCLGQQFAWNEMKLMLARLVSRFRLGLVEGEPEPVPCFNLTIKPQKELVLSLEKREHI
ncbi:cytochrome P450 4Z1-like [Asterias rubens]|uniref:cytochrome P450 4Z1-like n=1 Tax=Asterias rubens TaxID=7604 RepID=UPI0014559E78|nr:cytochrome P450 4Z1-like [Asterias rubens]